MQKLLLSRAIFSSSANKQLWHLASPTNYNLRITATLIAMFNVKKTLAEFCEK